MVKKEIPKVFYLYIHHMIYNINKRHQVKRSDLMIYLYNWRIPKKIRPLIIKELELLGLIKYVDKVFIINKPLLSDDNINDFYDTLNMYS